MKERTMLCYEEEIEAPRDGCRCRECRLARERSLDTRIIEMVRNTYRQLSVKPSQNVIHQCVSAYIVGSIDLPTLYIEVIKSLAEQVDSAFERERKAVMTMLPRHFLPTV